MKAVKGDNQSKRLSRILSQSGKLNQSGKSSQSLILFTRLPILGKTKTRLVPHIGEEGALQIHWAILKDFSAVWKKLKRKEKKLSLLVFYDLIIYLCKGRDSPLL